MSVYRVLNVRISAVCLLAVMLMGCHQHDEEGAHPPPIPPAVDRQSGGTSEPAMGGGEPAGAIHGTIRIAPELADRVPPNAYLYVIARERADGGVPYAVERLPVPPFPFHYVLSQSEVMSTGKEG